MNASNNNFSKILIFRLGSWLYDVYFYAIPLRFKLFKKRFVIYILLTVFFFFLIKHLDYVFYEFAYSSKAGKYSIYKEILQTDAHWYLPLVSRGQKSLIALFALYNIYFIISSFSLKLYGFMGKYNEDLAVVIGIWFLSYNNWFLYAYTFYTCQANVMVLASILYLISYFIFHLILWDEEMDIYFENQVDLANKGRLATPPLKENATPEEIKNYVENYKFQEHYSDDDRPDLVGSKLKEETFEDWLLKNDDRLIIDHETLQLTGSNIQSAEVEALWDLEKRYNEHSKRFGERKRIEEEVVPIMKDLRKLGIDPEGLDPLKLERLLPPEWDAEIEFEMWNYLLVHPIRLHEDRDAWYRLNRIDSVRIFFLALYHFIKSGQYRVPKVVGPYCAYSPYFRVNVKSLEEWEKFKFLTFFIDLGRRIYSFFSVFHYYQTFKWFLFSSKFYHQRQKLRKRKSHNYNFFKSIK